MVLFDEDRKLLFLYSPPVIVISVVSPIGTIHQPTGGYLCFRRRPHDRAANYR